MRIRARLLRVALTDSLPAIRTMPWMVVRWGIPLSN